MLGPTDKERLAALEAGIPWIKDSLGRIELGQKELHSDNGSPRGIAWDRSYLHVTDSTDQKSTSTTAMGRTWGSLPLSLILTHRSHPRYSAHCAIRARRLSNRSERK